MCHSKCGCGGGVCITGKVARVLLIIGGLNWGLVGVGMFMGSNLNVVNMIFGNLPTVEAIVYLLVGISAVVKIFGCRCKKCKEACASCSTDSKMEGGM